MKRGLGTQLAHLLELLDSAVQDAYAHAGLATRPRYTPVIRALAEQQPLTIGQIASIAGISQPAATQTIALMLKEGLVLSSAGRGDARQRLIRLSKRGTELLPRMQACWRATAMAAGSLDAELPLPLSAALQGALDALQRKPFAVRIAEARQHLEQQSDSVITPATVAASAPSD